MQHNWELLSSDRNTGEIFGCSRCGQLSGIETDDNCQSVSDGEMYKHHPNLPQPPVPAPIDRNAVERAMKIKRDQVAEYRDTLLGRDDESGAHARAIAEGRLLQLDQDLALISLQPQL